ncbi:hypothetical protein Baya_4427 [Bagarius yarrelli]|uniref:Uncharacterized protein n=1 Tax=Bagarius yarrelli TaxID=175774 RepID=A0A556TQ51_BAGYA|nr:hypothetical protein Baya_4427 [Bagarius yarrelli]
MRPSSAISFDSGLDRGVPWGRDLITFMTSAAGYMMRTLQKPRKNKPSKRQVNHRRFLHNMIQRKFTEIEAANHQLASALFSVDTESQSEEHSSHKYQESEKKLKKGEAETKQLDEDNSTGTLDGLNKSSLVKSPLNNLENREIYQLRKDKADDNSGENSSEEITDFTCETPEFHWTSVELSDLTPITNIILDDTVCTSLEGIEKTTANSHVQVSNLADSEEEQQQYSGLTLFNLSPMSPVSPLSLNSCDFEVQIQPDVDDTTQIQHIAESLQMDSLENLELIDTDEYLQHIDQKDLAAVWDIYNEEDSNCFQDSFPFLNASHTDFVMDRKNILVDEDICEKLHQITTVLDNPVKDINEENQWMSNFTYSPEHCDFVGYHNQAKRTSATVDCYLNQPEISTAVQNFRDVWEQEPEHNQSKNWEQNLSYYNHAPSKLKERYHTPSDEKKKITESGSIPNVNSVVSNHVSPLSMSTARCYGFHTPLHANSNCLRDSCCFSNQKGNQSIPSFEGVAQSFPAPYQNSHPYSVSTPPLNDDWLFSNIGSEADFMIMEDDMDTPSTEGPIKKSNAPIIKYSV